jgi:hypothetical protein
MEAKSLGLEVPRAKALRPSDSGVFRAAVHGAESVPANDCSLSDSAPHSAPVLSCSGRIHSLSRRAAREEMASALDVAMSRARASNVDVAAATDESPQRVADMRNGHRPITAEHMLLLARRLPEVFEGLVQEMVSQ